MNLMYWSISYEYERVCIDTKRVGMIVQVKDFKQDTKAFKFCKVKTIPSDWPWFTQIKVIKHWKAKGT